MRYPDDHKRRIRERLVVLASEMVRRKGVAGVSVAGVMAEAEMTVGGFYRHFDSQESLVADALAEAMRASVGLLTAGLESQSGRELEQSLIERYLSDWHFSHPEQGCPFAAAGSEIVRLAPAARAQVLAEATQLIDLLAAALGGGRRATARAWMVLAACAGGMAIARALGGTRGREVLALVRQGLKQQGGS